MKGFTKDLKGQKFGMLEVVNYQFMIGGSKWLCKCDCGKTALVPTNRLMNGNTRSCGCYRKESKKKRLIDLTGKKFNRLTVINRVENKNSNHVIWLCRCDCGNEVRVYRDNLLRGHTTSCGCYKKEMSGVPTIKHGLSNHPLYTVWHCMLTRCKDINNERYCGRGIAVCKEWEEDFLNFYEWARGKYAEGLQLDREDNSKGYSPDNCRFITRVDNNCNKDILKANKTGYVGVFKSNDKWGAGITYDGTVNYLGVFLTKEEAVEARNKYIRDNNLPHPIQEVKKSLTPSSSLDNISACQTF